MDYGHPRSNFDADWWERLPVSMVEEGFGLGLLLLRAAALPGSRRLAAFLERFSETARRYMVVIRNSLALYDVAASVHDAKAVVDSTKSPLRGKLLYLAAPGRVHCVYLVRDGRAVAASTIRRENVSMRAAAGRWKWDNLKALWALRSVPAASLTFVRYEDLCADPEGESTAIVDSIGLQAQQGTGKWSEFNPDDNHQIPGNPMLFSNVGTIRIDERWRSELSSQQLNVFEKVAGSMNRRFGYT